MIAERVLAERVLSEDVETGGKRYYGNKGN